jgi:hypothetical protein
VAVWRSCALAGKLLLWFGVLAILSGARIMRAEARISQGVTIRGAVVIGSHGLSEPVYGLNVSVYGISGDRKSLIGTAQTGPDGGFSLSDVAVDPDQQLAALVTFDGVTYASASSASAAGSGGDLSITVYGTTDSSAAITVDRATMVITGADAKTGLVTLVESYHLTNGKDLTYVGDPTTGQRQSLRFPLFAGARSLVALDGFTVADATPTADGFVLTSPVRPGQSVISFTYDVPYGGSALSLRRSLPYGATLAQVILPGAIIVHSPQLDSRGSVQLGGRSFDTIERTSVAPGTTIEVLLSGLPPKGGLGPDWDSLPIRVLSLLAIAATVSAAVLFVRYRRRSASPASLKRERERLLRIVAALDDAQAGGQAEESYQAERRRALDRLRALTRRLRAEETPKTGTGDLTYSGPAEGHAPDL